MRKLIVTCQCGQRMQVPQSAFGKAGLCPNCGHTVRITNQNATRPGGTPGGGLFGTGFGRRKGAEPSEEDKRRFGEAVDLITNKRYGEALAIFDSLARIYPGNPDIENGRMRCMRFLQQRPAGLLQGETAGREAASANLDAETVRRTILAKLLYGASEEIQLQAAELAARMLGMLDENGRATAQQDEPQKQDEAPADEAQDAEETAEPEASDEEPSDEVRDADAADSNGNGRNEEPHEDTPEVEPPPFTIDIEADQAAAMREKSDS